MKYLKLEIGNDPFDEPKRVLTFGKFKGHTIKEVYDYVLMSFSTIYIRMDVSKK